MQGLRAHGVCIGLRVKTSTHVVERRSRLMGLFLGLERRHGGRVGFLASHGTSGSNYEFSARAIICTDPISMADYAVFWLKAYCCYAWFEQRYPQSTLHIFFNAACHSAPPQGRVKPASVQLG